MKAKTLLEIPIWKGNRILDVAHVAEIQKAVHTINHLDSGYHIVQYEELDGANKPILGTYIIDGQHRAAVLKDHFRNTLCEPDFDVLVTQKRVTDEEEAIAFFNSINKCKPQAWKSDPSLLVNKYIAALTKRFNGTKKVLLLRPGATHRPYLSSDKLREQLTLCATNLKQTSREVQEFVERVVKWNVQELGATQMAFTLNEIPKKEAAIVEKCIDTGFLLALDPTLKWIRACLE